MSARTDYPELDRLTMGIGVEIIEDAEEQTERALDEIDQLRRIVHAALDWQAWAAAHADDPEGNADRDTVLYRVVSEYRESLMVERP